uniref:hypothetical protein n=1 Tax=Aliarcobacter sp. TaxID=2321116 RepID=UPI004047388B
MKTIILSSLFFTNILFANYAFTNENAGKIDMHGGKGEKLINHKNSLSNKNFNNLGNIGIEKPSTPNEPKLPSLNTPSSSNVPTLDKK